MPRMRARSSVKAQRAQREQQAHAATRALLKTRRAALVASARQLWEGACWVSRARCHCRRARYARARRHTLLANALERHAE